MSTPLTFPSAIVDHDDSTTDRSGKCKNLFVEETAKKLVQDKGNLSQNTGLNQDMKMQGKSVPSQVETDSVVKQNQRTSNGMLRGPLRCFDWSITDHGNHMVAESKDGLFDDMLIYKADHEDAPSFCAG